MWFNPPVVPSLDDSFNSQVFFWRCIGVWRNSLCCPRPECPARENKNAFVYRCGYSKTVRQICHISRWYSMLAEVLACNACKKAAAETEDHSIGHFTSWEGNVVSQLSPAHRAMFPAGLTLRSVSASFQFYFIFFKEHGLLIFQPDLLSNFRRGVDKQVI